MEDSIEKIVDDLVEKIESRTVREWAKTNPDLVLAALEAEYLKAHPDDKFKANLEEGGSRD